MLWVRLKVLHRISLGRPPAGRQPTPAGLSRTPELPKSDERTGPPGVSRPLAEPAGALDDGSH
jgi:hypothetical protein